MRVYVRNQCQCAINRVTKRARSEAAVGIMSLFSSLLRPIKRIMYYL